MVFKKFPQRLSARLHALNAFLSEAYCIPYLTDSLHLDASLIASLIALWLSSHVSRHHPAFNCNIAHIALQHWFFSFSRFMFSLRIVKCAPIYPLAFVISTSLRHRQQR
ncbi:hypothetical protein L208DRAFT_606559 [Tricholoma matsutake]|nr:hypothetical protein L208DRAFT_606559 [Tricholoma matsutake 945]